MKRRTFIKAIAGAIAAVPFVKAAKKPEPKEYATVGPALATPAHSYFWDGYNVKTTIYASPGVLFGIGDTIYLHPDTWANIQANQ